MSEQLNVRINMDMIKANPMADEARESAQEKPKPEIDGQAEERNRLITIAGGEEIIVTFLNGSVATVKVRQIPVTKLESFMTRIVDEANQISILCDKPYEWGDTLTLASANEIIEKGMEINKDFLNAWCRRRAKWMEMMNTGVVADLQRKLDALQQVLGSVVSAPKSPLSTNSPPAKSPNSADRN